MSQRATRRCRPPAVAVLLVWSTLAPAAPAAAPPDEAVFGERIEVRALDIEVVVRDAGGRRVHGLTAADFELLVDGSPVAIDAFGEVVDGAWSAPPGAPPAAADPAVAPQSRAPEATAAPTHVLIVIDDFLTTLPRDRNRLLRLIEQQLGALGPEDLVAVVSFDGLRARLLVPWTPSRPVLAAGLREARDHPTRGLAFSGLLDSEIRQFTGATGVGTAAMVVVRRTSPEEICRAVRVLEGHLERLVAGLSAVLRSAAPPPGRRVAMLLSGGWPQSVATMLTAGRPRPESCFGKGAEIYRPLYETANLLGYTLYPVDVPLRAGSAVDAADSDPVDLDLLPEVHAKAAARQGELHATLQRLARETGGRALTDGAKDGALARVVADTRSYYRLGFTPDWQADDQTHEVAVRVRRPGLAVRHRRSFRDLSPATRLDHATEGLLLFDLRAGLGPLELEVGPSLGGRGKPVVPLRVVVPLAAVTLLAAGDGWRAELQLRVAAIDARGQRSEIADVPLVIERARAPEPGERVVHEIPLRLRRGPQVLAVTLYDPVGGAVLAGRSEVEP